MRRGFFFSIGFVLLASVAGGCGGGGSAPPDDAVSVNELDGATGVAVDSAFKYTFSQAVDASTVTPESFFMVMGDPASADIVKAGGDAAACDSAQAIGASVGCATTTECMLTPSAELEGGTAYTVCLMAGEEATALASKAAGASGIFYADGQPFPGFSPRFTTAGDAPTYAIGGTVAGLAGTGLLLQNNGADDLAVAADGLFAFATKLANRAAYVVTVKTQPTSPTQTCTVNGGAGAVAHADVTGVQVVCSTESFTVGGTVAGLDGQGLVLWNNGGDDLAIDAGGAFIFPTKVASGAAYAVTVKTQPAVLYQTCTVSNGAGTIVASPVDGVLVNCVTPPSRFAYATNKSGNSVSAYAMDADTGELTEVAGSPFAAGSTPVSVAVDPLGKFVYVVNQNANSVSAYTVDPATGALTTVVGSPFATGNVPNFVAVDPAGTFAYVVNVVAKSISLFAINAATGALTSVTSYGAGAWPVAMALDPTGRFAYVADNGSGTVLGYTVDAATGALTAMAGSPFAAGTDPVSISVDPTGTFAYVVNQHSFDVSAYTIDAASGVLTPVTGSPFVDATGKFACVMDNGTASVRASAINAATGALTLVGSYAAGTYPVFVAADTTGRFVYAANQNGNNISGYTVDAGTGALTPMAGSPFAAGSGPWFIAITR